MNKHQILLSLSIQSPRNSIIPGITAINNNSSRSIDDGYITSTELPVIEENKAHSKVSSFQQPEPSETIHAKIEMSESSE